MPYVDFMETIIAIAALLGAFYFLRQFFKFIKKGAVCDSQSNSVVQKAIKRIQKIFKERKNI
ncbi:MAG: PGF-CTERM sorting domain-containing protein [Candidatus Pacebacteria bacterium]|nr:PGF-CTERM sorting domain-containing protein [Candidatus Paceibacterota bacterium]